MNTIKVIHSGLRKMVLAASAVAFMVSCTQDEEILEATPAAAEQEALVIEEQEADVASVTVSGVYTEFSGSVDCATCTYAVPVNVRVVDGTALGLKPGSVVCIGKGRKAGEIEFVNMIGTENAPIIIGNCDEE